MLLAILVALVPGAFWLRLRAPLPAGVRDGVGGAAYVVSWSVSVVWVWPSIRPWRAVSGVLACTCVLEFLQLWHPGWLEAIRATLPGRLLLGTTFDPTDFPPYFVGAAIAWAILRWVTRFLRIKSPQSTI